MSKTDESIPSKRTFVGLLVVVAVISALVTALMVNMIERKTEARQTHVRMVEVSEDDPDPEKWATNWPRQYESYQRTAIATRTRFGGSEALPEQKIERDPWLKRMFLGYAFSIAYRDRRGHASIMPLYRQLG